MIKRLVYTALWVFLAYFSAQFFYTIYMNYLTKNPTDWSHEVLKGLGNLYMPAFGMYIHFAGGSLILILGLLQILPISRRNMIVHRIIGNIYILACLLTSLGGNIYIYTNGTTGGINMNVAFSISGWLLFIFAIVTYIQARRKRVDSHKNWAIRLWSLGLSSLFYRLSYYFLFWCGYSFTSPEDFLRPLDMFLDWWFFLAPLAIAEVWIRRDKVLFLLLRKR